jgi:outer membrane protein assembly factor BamE (lipoprotein component of BamABCDE complex)
VTQPTPTPATPAQPGQVASTQAAPPPTASLRERGAQIADEAMLKALVQGQTTKADVREIFGVPQEIVLSSGIETYLYIREKSVGWISKACERTEMLTVRFDPTGVLKEYEYRFAGK